MEATTTTSTTTLLQETQLQLQRDAEAAFAAGAWPAGKVLEGLTAVADYTRRCAINPGDTHYVVDKSAALVVAAVATHEAALVAAAYDRIGDAYFDDLLNPTEVAAALTRDLAMQVLTGPCWAAAAGRPLWRSQVAELDETIGRLARFRDLLSSTAAAGEVPG